LLAGLADSLADTRAFKGCISVEVFTDADNPDTIVLLEKWENKEDQAAYFAWRIETGMMDAIAPIMASDPKTTWLAPHNI
ncbi:MAG: antibiotic biosynthesis monooxygenase, partial [Acidimicrobiaceae bacterium]